MNSKSKIGIIVLIQIMLIIVSFTILASLETESFLLGNVINIAGKNRLLTMAVYHETEKSLYGQNDHDPLKSLNSLETNLIVLKEGGIENNVHINPLNKNFLSDYNQLKIKFIEYKSLVISTLDPQNESPIDERYSKFKQKTDEFLEDADSFTNKLGEYEKFTSERFIQLETFLMLVNIGLHLFLIYLIIKISKRESERRIKLEKFSIIGELSAKIAHDLRNPLSLIKMGIDIIQKNENLSPQSTEKIRIIEKSIARMSHQINDVMTYVKTSSLQISQNKIDEIIEESLLRANLPKTISVEYTPTMTKIFCDKEKIIIVFVNLFTNANEAMEGKGKLTIKLQSQSNAFQIIVENSGSSIPTKILKSIFTPLFTTRNHGTGLGLATCKNIISEHKGTILALNHPTRFIITLPKV
jgi:signal transduction histidine kinase